MRQPPRSHFTQHSHYLLYIFYILCILYILKPMKIDAHQHFWQYDPGEYAWISEAMPQLKRDLLPQDLEPLLHAKGYDGCVAVQARQTENETEVLAGLAARFPFIRGVVGWVDLKHPDLAKRLDHFRINPAIKGFRHIVQDEPDDRFLVDERFVQGVRMLGEYGFTYDILVYEKHLPVVAEFLEKCPDQPFVLDHIGKPDIRRGMSAQWKEGIQRIAGHPHVYCKLSGLVTEAEWNCWRAEDFFPYLQHVYEAFGPNRLMIGSDWPVCLLAAPGYAQTVEIVEAFLAPLTPETQTNILGENARRFYDL
jgi:L-fuconolactonase